MKTLEIFKQEIALDENNSMLDCFILEAKKDKFGQTQLNALKVAFSGIKKIDPSGDAYKKLKKILSSMSDEMLNSAIDAKINFVSSLARNELMRRKAKNESVVEVSEASKSDYTILHKDFSSAVQHAIEVAEKRGFKVDEEDWANKVASGPRKPSNGQTNSYHIELIKDGKTSKKMLHIQVYNTGNKYELNTYIS